MDPNIFPKIFLLETCVRELQHKAHKEEFCTTWCQFKKLQMKFSVDLLVLVHSNVHHEPTESTYLLLKKKKKKEEAK